MPFFIIIPIWMGVLVCSGIIAIFRRTRALAIYVAVSSTFALIFSILLSTVAIVGGAKLASLSDHAPGWVGWLLLDGYVGGIVAGGAIGAVLGILLVFWMRRRRRSRRERNKDDASMVRQPFGYRR